jgi:hypothetical protein
VIVLPLGQEPRWVEIRAPGEKVRFRLSVPSTAEYRIRTLGVLDTVMSLYQSGAGGAQIAHNDDPPGIPDFNARIEHSLAAGEYDVEVYLYDSSATGQFRIVAERL